MADVTSADLWLESLSRLPLRDAVLFADDRSACALSWAVGLPALLELGVCNVVRLGDDLIGDAAAPTLPATCDSPSTAVVLCSTFLPEVRAALRVSLRQSGFRFASCTIACTFSDRAHRDYLPAAAAYPLAEPDVVYTAIVVMCSVATVRGTLEKVLLE